MVSLPDKAFSSDIGEEECEITPCEGCQHIHHLRQLEDFGKDIKIAKLMNLKNWTVLIHHVTVNTKPTSEYSNCVFCSCDCELHIKYPENC